MSKEFGTPIDKSLTGSLSSSLSTLPMNHSEEQNTKREDDAEYITMSPRSLEKSEAFRIDSLLLGRCILGNSPQVIPPKVIPPHKKYY